VPIQGDNLNLSILEWMDFLDRFHVADMTDYGVVAMPGGSSLDQAMMAIRYWECL
jgi:hypothetical protein